MTVTFELVARVNYIRMTTMPNARYRAGIAQIRLRRGERARARARFNFAGSRDTRRVNKSAVWLRGKHPEPSVHARKPIRITRNPIERGADRNYESESPSGCAFSRDERLRGKEK